MAEFTFPPKFLWGTSTSSHQVEGFNSNNDWWMWEQAGRVREPSGAACDQYRRYRDDFDLIRSLGQNAHRFSIEWSRVEPKPGQRSDEALAHYRDMVTSLRERGIEPIVTLHHFTNPIWLGHEGGWVNPAVVDRFARYTRWVVEALGDKVSYWLTINEPLVYANMHYLDGQGPPGSCNVGQGFRVIEHLVRAHAASFHTIHDMAQAAGRAALVSYAHHAQPFMPCHPWWIGDRIVADQTERIYNFRILEALTEGRLRLPGRRTMKVEEAVNTLDYIGLNYYGRIFLRLGYEGPTRWLGLRCSTRHHREVTERNALDWDVYPPGIRDVIRWALPFKKPILITENGICTADDAQRERFILRHLAWVAKAIAEGAPVFGYLYWSLLDNFEWAEGYGPRFGMIEVDYTTQARRVRPSAQRFAEVCRSNRLAIDDALVG
jgi:beta-glucosidase